MFKSLKITFALIFFTVCAQPALAACGYSDLDQSDSKQKVVSTPKASGRVELLTIPRYSKGPWPSQDYRVSVLVMDATTCEPAGSTVWYKDNAGANHDLNTFPKTHPLHKTQWSRDISRPQFGVFRLRAWRSKRRPLVFVVSYQAAPPTQSHSGTIMQPLMLPHAKRRIFNKRLSLPR